MVATAKKTEPLIMEPGVVAELPLSIVDFDPEQPRKDVPKDHIDALADDIKGSRVKQPITVRPNPEAEGRYIIKYGECRYRASKQAKKRTIPALLDTEDDTKADPLSRLLDQVKENHIRRDLNPMEWAAVLRRMRDDHKIKSIANIEATLKQHGITNMGRAYISNIIRLGELPEWAQELTRAGKLTTAHGKYLLPATSSEKVIEDLRIRLADEEEELSVRQLQDLILRLFKQHHITLDGWWRPFEYKEECIPQCQKIRKVSTETESNTFCLDKTCYKNKEKAATTNRSEAEEEQTTQAAPIVADDGTVDIDAQDVDYTPLANAQFDTAACEACGHKHIAVWKSNDEQFRMPACFEPGDCYQQKTREAMAERHRKIGNENTIERWLRTVLPGKLSGDTDAQLSLIGACALNLDGFEWGLDSAMEAAAESAGIEDINALLQNGLLSYAETIFGELVKAAELPHLMPLATHAGVNINEWKPDDIWFQDLDKAELVELLINIQAYDESDSSRLKSMQNHELIERALDHAQKVPVPDEITEAWERLNSGGRVDDGELE